MDSADTKALARTAICLAGSWMLSSRHMGYPGILEMSSHKNHKRGPWSQTEDSYLISLVNHNGPLNWVRIAQFLGSRTPKQCRERYHQNLKPSLNHEPISAEEGAQIERMVAEMGKRWAEIARRLHNRSDNAVKNWWNGSQNRRKRTDRRKASFGPGLVSHHQMQHHQDHPHHLERHPDHGYGHHGHHVFDHNAHRAFDHNDHRAFDHHDHHRQQHHQHGHYEVSPNYYTLPPSFSDSRDAVPRTLPPFTRLPAPLSPGFGRHHIDTPLHSPSALSPGAESVDMAPSLTSDNGSCYSTSPRDSNRDLASPVDLPPLKNLPIRHSNRDSLSPTDVKLPGFQSLPTPTFPGVRTNDYRQSAAAMGSAAHYSSDESLSRPAQLPTAPSSPANNSLPALRLPLSPPATNVPDEKEAEKEEGPREKLDISRLIS